jgi:Tol biopolymer transport system component
VRAAAIWSVPASGGTPARLGDDAFGTMPDVAPDGTVAFFGREGAIWTMGPDGSDPGPLSVDAGGRLFSPRWSPDGSKLAALRFHEGERTVADPGLRIGGGLAMLDAIVIDPAGGDVIDVGPRVVTNDNPVSWTPDSEALLVNRYLGDRTGAERRRSDGGGPAASAGCRYTRADPQFPDDPHHVDGKSTRA